MNTESHRFPYIINGESVSSADRTPIGSQLLADAGFEPADDFVLIQRTSHGTRVVSSDELLALGGVSTHEFFAFEGGVAYELTLNEHSIYWGAQKIDLEKVRVLGNVPDDHELLWERADNHQIEVLPERGTLELAAKGVEHLRTQKRPPQPVQYAYFVDSVEYKTAHESLTGAQIIAKVLNWNPANALVLEGDGADPDEVIRPTATVIFKDRKTPAHFIGVPPATFGAS